MTSSRPSRLTAKSMVVLGLLGALMFVAKMAMAPLPNIEPVSLLVMVYTAVFGMLALYPIYIYVGLECLIWGIHLWTINYLYIWLILAVLTWLFRRMESPLGWAILSGAFGLSFGALCALIYVFMEGWQFALSWWISGIPFDVPHSGGNFVMALALFRPCRKILTRLSRQIGLIPPKET